MERGNAKGNPKGLVLNQVSREFAEAATTYLSEGNHVLLAGQGGRRPELFPDEKFQVNPKYDQMPTTLGTFFLNAARHKVRKFFYMPIGLSMHGVDDYSKQNVGGYNLFKKCRVTRGLTLYI